MNQKTWLIALLALILIPLAAAQVITGIGEGIENTLSLVFNTSIDLAYIKAGIWLVLFFLIFKSAERIFPANRGMAVIIALVISMLGSRFMPDYYLDYFGGTFFIILLFLSPYLIGNVLGDLTRLGRGGKTFLIILFYAGFGYYITKWQSISVPGPAQNAFDTARGWMGEHTWIALVIIGLICIYLLWGRRGGGGGGPVIIPASSGGGGPSFWRGLGRGARGTGQGAGWLAGRGREWMMRKAAEAKMKKELMRRARGRGQWPGYG